ncbi:hypothetical protein [uncultured Desulfosarcina sp.]|uniref:hypothetical protein n=1 Tax=uncultured Desulfosarcina sp. TaxID=218289 RepID=UPI0029C74E75|nr:hypothetical protein [uncultured Desulfosarcina sp.]
MMLRTVAFAQALAHRLEGDRLSLRIRPADIARYYGADVSPLRVRLALENLLRRPIAFYSGNRCTFSPLIVYLSELPNGLDLQVFFSEKSRTLLQNHDGHWQLDRVLIELQDTPRL